MNSIYPETDTDKLGNRVQTRFPCIEIEFIELDFHVSWVSLETHVLQYYLLVTFHEFYFVI